MELGMDYLKSFKELLKLEAGYLSELVALEEEKYDALKQVDITLLMKVNTNEEDILQHLASIERKRKDLILNLSKIYHFNPNLSLTELFSYIMDENSQSLKNELIELRTKIKNEIGKLQISMHENSQIIQANLEIINLTMNFANRNAQKETYDYRSKKESKESIYLVNQIA